MLNLAVVPVMELRSRSSSSNQGLSSLPPADHSWNPRLEPELAEDQNFPGLFVSQKDEAFRTETLRMLLHSVGGGKQQPIRRLHRVNYETFLKHKYVSKEVNNALWAAKTQRGDLLRTDLY